MSDDDPRTYIRASDGAVMGEIRPGRFRNAATHTRVKPDSDRATSG